jgi:sugar-specific transcriptional regulator TrmB
MEEHELVSHIEELGLSNKEARVYLACLSIGAASVQSIADKAGIKRVTAYVILDSLLGLGLVAQSLKAKKTYFVAEDPVHLQRLLERRAKELTEQRQGLKAILPRLAMLTTVSKELPEIKLYDGMDSVRALFSDFFTTYSGDAEELLSLCNLDELNEFIPEADLRKEVTGRLARGIRSRVLYTSAGGPVKPGKDTKHERFSRFVPLDRYPVAGDISILGDYVLMISLTGSRPIGVSIRNGEMARTMKAIFEMAWDLAGSFSAE